MSEAEPEAPAQQWAVLELMGHRQAIGVVSEATLFGRAMVQVDRIDTEPEAVQFYGPESVYCLTPVTEEQARLLAKSRYKTHIVPPALTAGVALEDDDDDDGTGPWGFEEGDCEPTPAALGRTARDVAEYEAHYAAGAS